MTNSVAIVMGSKSDMALAEATKEVLDGYGIGSVIKVLSAHRTPEALKDFIENSKSLEDKNGFLSNYFFNIEVNRNYKFTSGPFTDKIFKIIP